MIYKEDKHIKIGGVALPGLVRKFEITRTGAIDEVEVEGLPVKPKQAVGYEDAQIKIEMILDDSAGESLEGKIAKLNSLFRKNGQDIPQPLPIISKKTAAAGIDQVLIQKLTVTEDNKSSQQVATLELCEYIPIPIAATSSTGSSSGSSALTEDYQTYLNNSRGSSPLDKTPIVDDRMIGPLLEEKLESYRLPLYGE